MLAILKRFSLPIGIALAFLFALVIVQSSEAFHDCIENAQYKASQTTHPKQLTDVPITFVMRERCWGDYAHRYSDGIIAVFTVILAGSTIALWLSTHNLWKVTDDTLKHSEKTTQRELRAYIGIEPRGVKHLIGEDSLVGHIAIKNYGKIPAKNISMFTITDYFSDGSKFFSKIGDVYPSKTSLPPRAEMIFGTATVVKVDSIKAADDSDADWIGYIFVYGKVTYTDELGTDGWTEFCHRYPCKMLDSNFRISRKYGRYHEIDGNASS
jgi:hypothetical protein